MGMSVDGQNIYCDNYGCAESTPAPVALFPDQAPGITALAARGWLFMSRRGICNHYCPRCAPQLLRRPDLPRLAMDASEAR